MKNGSFVAMTSRSNNPLKCAFLGLLFMLAFIGCRQEKWAPQLSKASGLEVQAKFKADSQMVELIKPYRQGLEKAMNDTIGLLGNDLTKGEGESLLGNFVSDLLLVKAVEIYDTVVDMAAVTNGGLRVPLKKGYIKVGDVFELMPFDNELLLLRINGRQVEQLFNYMYHRKNLTVANTKVVFDHYGHLQSLTIGEEPFEPSRIYTLAISDYLATGGDQMDFLTASESAVSAHYKVRDAIIDYFKEKYEAEEVVEVELDGRFQLRDDESHE